MLTQEELIARKMQRIDEVHRYEPKRTALMVIDMQTSFMDPDSSLNLPMAWDILPPIKKMVEFCRSKGILVVFTEFVASPNIPCMRGDPWGPEHLPAEPGQPTGWGYPSNNSMLGVKGPEDPTTIPELKPLANEPVIQGYTLDKFYGTPLDLYRPAFPVASRYVSHFQPTFLTDLDGGLSEAIGEDVLAARPGVRPPVVLRSAAGA